MPSHFSTIGLPISNESDCLALANSVAQDAVSVEAASGRYLCWTSSCGAQIWLQLDDTDALIGMTPHFAGESQIRVGMTSRLTGSDRTALEGAFHGWADPTGDDPESGMYPFVFDSPDYQQHSDLVLPSIVSVQVAAFAHEISIFDSVDDFQDSQTGDLKFASQSFIPAGLFSGEGDTAESPKAYGILTGQIIQTAKRSNELTGNAYYWALVDSLGGQFDVVIDPELVENEPKVDGVLTGSFWLSGQLIM